MHRFFGVGINTYPGAPLAGCLNDELMHESRLGSSRYASADGWQGRRRLNLRATKSELINGLKASTLGLRGGDSFAFTFSGHGTEMVRNGKLQHVACPVDFCFDEAHSLWAHEVLEVLGNIPNGVKTLVFWDSCHSEWTAADRRILSMHTSRVIESRSYPLMDQPDVARENREARSLGQDAGNEIARAAASGAFPCCYIAGCGAKQTSADVRDASGAYGAATKYFWDAMDQNSIGNSMQEIVETANANLRRDQFEQVMQCQGLYAGMSVVELLGIKV